MEKKELVQKFFKGRAVPRPPYLPLLGTYLTKVDQVSVPSLLQDVNILYSAIINTQQLLEYDALILPIDPSLEAEALGGKIEWNDKEMPSISTTFDENMEVDHSTFVFQERISIIQEVIQRLVTVQGKNYPIIATMTGPFTILSKLYGTGIYSNSVQMKTALNSIIQALVSLCKIFGDAKVDGIMIYEDAHLEPILDNELNQCYKPIFNVIKFYNIFGILRLPRAQENVANMTANLPDTILSTQEFVSQLASVRTKGVALPDTFWEEPFHSNQYLDLWKEQNKRRLFLSTNSPLHVELNLQALQEKTSLLCAEASWQ